jgi:hypothetical protein
LLPLFDTPARRSTYAVAILTRLRGSFYAKSY